MKPTEVKLVAGFLLQEQVRFFDYLGECAVQPTEATLIVENLISESEGGIPTCVDQFSGFVGE